MKKIDLILFFVLSSCSRDEFSVKREFSVVQSYAYDFRDHENSIHKYYIIKGALGTEYDVIGLPIRNKSRGYVFLIAKSLSGDLVRVGDESVKIDRETYGELANSVIMSESVRSFCREMIQDSK